MNIEKNGKKSWSPVSEPRQRKTTSKGNWYNHYPWQDKVNAAGKVTQIGIRSRKVALNPFCEECELQGIYTLTQQVDHIKPINQANPYDTENGKYGEFLNIANLRSLCTHHHNVKSAKQRKRQ